MPRGRVPLPYAEQEGSGARNRGERLVVIANPRAGGGRAGASRDRIERAVDRAFEQARVVWTEGPRHATEIAREVAASADILAALGGDGTCHEVVNGLFRGEVPVSPRTIFTTLPFGTGGDLVRSLEIPSALDDALWTAATGITLPLDVGLATWPVGNPRVFINVLGVGVNAEVCRIANQSGKRLGGRVTFVQSIFRALRTYTAVPARWRWEGPEGPGEVEMTTLAAFVANGHYCGAGLWVGRDGRMNDGLFDVTLVGPLGAVAAARAIRHAWAGRLERIPGARRFAASVVHVETALPVETDGEPRAPGPLTIRVLPRSLQVRGGWLRPPGAA